MPKKILLVEDNPADVKLIRLALQSLGIVSEITHFADGLDVVEALFPKEDEGSFPVPDLVMLDLNMPRVDGLELLRKFRESIRYKQVPVAICTSSSSPQDQEEAMSLGASAFIHKPIELEPFLNDVGQAVKDILEGRRPARCKPSGAAGVRSASNGRSRRRSRMPTRIGYAGRAASLTFPAELVLDHLFGAGRQFVPNSRKTKPRIVCP